ncbi:zinc ribbon domain-containing protein [Levilactobacillus yiduensis]|uniref:zinc ribbon domain-containing protein n=1 Tax=Levilactobacillus yiduensis TaxID=2953880 RepID=UPI000EF2E22B|nr:zinc ribbon domain-containing protein [Levilactobacillus yiduensis]AYM01666.1 zinc ribbon domain-containing protein [Levilactobacillus brevis]
MKQTYYRICSNCGNQNAADANFCLKCGTTLSAADEYALIPHAADQTFPLFDLELTPDEVAQTKNFKITADQTIPAGYRSAGLIFAESDVAPRAGAKAAWEDLFKHVYALLLAKGYAGVTRVSIQPEPMQPSQLCLYGEALVVDASSRMEARP